MIIRDLKIQPYPIVWGQMKRFVDACEVDSEQEVWLLEHEPVFTLGVAGKESHVLINPRNIPLVRSDRGGQVTYHGPGQLIIYPLINLARCKLTVRGYVTQLEQLIIDLLKNYHINAARNSDMPGVYVDGAKIASIGIRVRRGWTLHGISLNVNMDLTPFSFINPCGVEKQKMICVSDFVSGVSVADIKAHCHSAFIKEYI